MAAQGNALYPAAPDCSITARAPNDTCPITLTCPITQNYHQHKEMKAAVLKGHEFPAPSSEYAVPCCYIIFSPHWA